MKNPARKPAHPHTHTHTYVCVCGCVGVCEGEETTWLGCNVAKYKSTCSQERGLQLPTQVLDWLQGREKFCLVCARVACALSCQRHQSVRAINTTSILPPPASVTAQSSSRASEHSCRLSRGPGKQRPIRKWLH